METLAEWIAAVIEATVPDSLDEVTFSILVDALADDVADGILAEVRQQAAVYVADLRRDREEVA